MDPIHIIIRLFLVALGIASVVVAIVGFIYFDETATYQELVAHGRLETAIANRNGFVLVFFVVGVVLLALAWFAN